MTAPSAPRNAVAEHRRTVRLRLVISIRSPGSVAMMAAHNLRAGRGKNEVLAKTSNEGTTQNR
jgi:hypothetical protein